MFIAVFLFVLSSCGDDTIAPASGGDGGDDNGNGDGAPDLRVAAALSAPDGTEATAGDTILIQIGIANDGDGAAREVAVEFAVPDRFVEVGETAVIHRAGKSVPAADGGFDLAPGDSADVGLLFTAPRFYPDGWIVDPAAAVTFRAAPVDSTAPPHLRIPVPSPVETIGNDGIDFTLVAPGVPEVFVSGSFNNWAPSADEYRLFTAPGGGDLGLMIQAAGAVKYKFILRDPGSGRKEWIGDPRATRLSPDGFGGYNSVAGTPLPAPVTPLAGGVDRTKLVIYELFTWDFSPAGDFEAIRTALTGGAQNLAALGINAIELLPVTGVRPDDFNWGYEPQFYFAPEPDYGSPEQFASLVAEAHANGIAVILDMVFNHVGRGAPLERIDERGERGVFINHDQGDVFGMKQLNWYSDRMRAFFLDCTLFWIERYGIDGFRMDLVDADDYAGYAWWRAEVRRRHPDFFVIGEDFRFPPSNSVTAAGLDAQWGGQHTDDWGGTANNFQQIVMALLEEDTYEGRFGGPPLGSFDAADNPMWAFANVIEPTAGYPSYLNEVKYIVSHDERRLTWEVEQAGSPEAALIGGAAKGKLGAAALLTATGIPMIYMGEEIGAGNYIPQDPTPNKIDWAAGDEGLRAVYANLIRLRLAHPTLASGGIAFFGDQWEVNTGPSQQDKTIAFWRYRTASESGADIVVAMNFDHDTHELDVPFPAPGTWYLFDPEEGSANEVAVEGGSLRVTLPASTARIYLKSTAYLP